MVLMQHRTDLLHLLREVLLLRFWLRKEEKGKIYFSKCFFVFINWYSNRKYAFRPKIFILSYLGPILSRILS